MASERIKQLAEQARQEFLKLPTGYKAEQVGMYPQLMEKFAELIVKECIFTLLWHGCDDSVPYIEWMAKNKLGVKE